MEIGNIVYYIENSLVEKVYEYLAFEGDINVTFSLTIGEEKIDSCPLLMLACIADNIKIVRLLLEFKTNVNTINSKGNTALSYCKSAEILKLILEYNFDYNIRYKYNNTIFHEVIEYTHFDTTMLNILLLKGDVNITNIYRETPLIIIINKCINDNSERNQEFVYTFILVSNLTIHITYGETYLTKICYTVETDDKKKKLNTELFTILFNNNSDLLSKANKRGDNALMAACAANNTEYINLIIYYINEYQVNFDINALDNDKYTALDLLCKHLFSDLESSVNSYMYKYSEIDDDYRMDMFNTDLYNISKDMTMMNSINNLRLQGAKLSYYAHNIDSFKFNYKLSINRYLNFIKEKYYKKTKFHPYMVGLSPYQLKLVEFQTKKCENHASIILTSFENKYEIFKNIFEMVL